jgi:trimeric autotransporter adhesin
LISLDLSLDLSHEVFMRILSLFVIVSLAIASAACGDQAAKVPPPDEQEDCGTAGDEDGNGLADCKDPACASAISCRPACGNSRMDPGEVCDDGNAINGDGCDNNCTVTACGNGVMTAGEGCDDGNQANGDGCDDNCTLTACGNGIMTAGEACDDGNQTNGDGCERTCTLTPATCGNHLVDEGEACDDGNRSDGDGCDSNCTLTACGNGIMTAGEVCDDGNTTNWDGCDSSCTPSVFAYVKASNTSVGDAAGDRVALSADGSTLAVSADLESSAATGVDGNQADNSAESSGAVYVFTHSGTAWTQQAYIKASNTGANDHFGVSLALSADGSTLAVGAIGEDSAGTNAGAVYVFARSGTTWTHQAYVKASKPHAGDQFGFSVALSGDGGLLAVGATGESSAAIGVDGDQDDTSAESAGAVYTFTRNGTDWTQQSYIKASNTDEGDAFGFTVALSADGSILAVGAIGEASAATEIAGDQSDDSAASAGAVYVFTRDGATWSEPKYLKSPTTHKDDRLGFSLALSRDGSTLAAGARGAAAFTGAVNVFARDATTWSHQAQITASNASPGDLFGSSLALSSDGAALAVGALGESSAATGIGGDQTNDSARFAGAVYVFTRNAAAWGQKFYVKAPNSGGGDLFGNSVALSGDGVILAVGAPGEDSAATGIDGPQLDDAGEAGAAYVF